MRRLLSLLILGLLAVRSLAQAAPPFDDPRLLFQARGLISDGAAVGVPLGGLGTGRLDLCADGSFRHLTLGPTTAMVERLPDAGFELDVAREGQPALRRALAAGASGMGTLLYRGIFPRSFLRASDPALGVRVDLEAWAPLVPHDVEASSWPCVGFLVTLREEAGLPAEATLLLRFPGATALPPVALAGRGEDGVSIEARADAVLARVALAPGAQATAHFALAWPVHDHPAATRSADASACAGAFLDRWPELHEATRAWQALLFESGLPRWWAERLCNDLAPLVTNTRISAAGVLATAEAGKGLGGITGTLDQRRVASIATAVFFPELDRSELAVFAQRQAADGAVPHHVGTLDGPLPPDAGFLPWPDLAASFALQVARTWLWTGDREAVAPLVPHVRAALRWLVAQDTDGDGLPDGGSTFDYGRAPPGFSYTASLSLAALEAGRRLGQDFGDAELEQLAAQAAPRVRDALVTRLWNGRWFASVSADATQGGGSFLSQLAGEWTARAFGLPPILPAELVERAADSLVALHGGASRLIPPLEVQPNGRPGPATFGWLPYTMTDYVSLLLQLERADAAWTALAGLDRCVVETSGEPFDVGLYYDSVTGRRARAGYDWYMSAPASWWTLYATAGFGLDVPRGQLRLAPVLPAALLHADLPLFAPGFTARLAVDDASFGVQRTLSLATLATHGPPLVLRRLATRAPPTASERPVSLELELDGAPLAARVTRDGRELLAELEAPVTLRAGSVLRARLAEPAGRAVGAALEAARERATQVLENESLRLALHFGPRGLQSAELSDTAGHAAQLDVADLFQLLVLPASGDELDVRTDSSWNRRVRVARVDVRRDGAERDAPCLFTHDLELRGHEPDGDFEPIHVEVETSLQAGPSVRWRLRARSPLFASARAASLRFPRLALVDPHTVGAPLSAELCTQPGQLLADPVRALDVLTEWLRPPAAAWGVVHGPSGSLELRGATQGQAQRVIAQGDRHEAVLLGLQTAVLPRRGEGDGETRLWADGWDISATATLRLQ